jgi:hypothetical protein
VLIYGLAKLIIKVAQIEQLPNIDPPILHNIEAVVVLSRGLLIANFLIGAVIGRFDVFLAV